MGNVGYLLFPTLVWATYRCLYYLRLITPYPKRFAADLPLAIPGVLGLVALAALYINGIAVDGGVEGIGGGDDMAAGGFEGATLNNLQP